MSSVNFKSIIRPALVGLILYGTIPLLIHLFAAYSLPRVLFALYGNFVPADNIIVAMGLDYNTYYSFDAFLDRFRTEPYVLLSEIYSNPLKLVTIIMTNILELGFVGLGINEILKTEDFPAFAGFLGTVVGLLVLNFLPLILAKIKPGYNSDVDSIILRFLIPLISYLPISIMSYYFLIQHSPSSSNLILSGILNAVIWTIVWFSFPKRSKGGKI